MERMVFVVPKMSNIFTKEEYHHLCDQIWEHNNYYFVKNAPKISDFEYDQLFNELLGMEKSHPEWIFPGSPSQRVGERITEGFKTERHRKAMLSLANTYSFEEIEEFIQRVSKWVGEEQLLFHVELKMDGIAISLVYENRLLVRAVTRGDGILGEDVTNNVRTIASLPLQLPAEAPDFLEVRGEIYMSKATFHALNAEREKEGKALFANPRNAAGGSLKLLDPLEVKKRHLAIASYAIGESSGKALKSQYESIEYLKSLHLPVVEKHLLCKNFAEIREFALLVEGGRGGLPFEIDGIVVKIDTLRLQEELGVTGKNYRWAVAYKFAAEKAVTRIHAITVQVGRTGVLTPVAELEPIFVAGSTIARATLHNEDEVQRKDIRVGDYVVIEKGGDVIPKVVSVLFERREEGGERWSMPTLCPACGLSVVRSEGEVAVRCPNASSCPAQTLKRIIFFASKTGMDIEHLGKKVVEQLVDSGLVEKIEDIYRLTKEDLLTLRNFKEKSVENLLQSIEESKKVALSKLIMALGIPYVGVETAGALAAYCKSLSLLSHMTEEELQEIEGVGVKVADSIVTFFADREHQEEIAHLLEYGVTPYLEEVGKISGHAFAGKSFVLTGTLANYSRSEATELIKERGGVVSASLNNSTDYLLLGESPGSKYEKAQKLGVLILSEESFTSSL